MHAPLSRRTAPFLSLVLVTAIWGVTFVQVKDAVALYPLFAFLAVRFVIASLTLSVPAARLLRGLGRRGFLAGAALGVLLGSGYALQTAGLERTTVSSTGFMQAEIPESVWPALDRIVASAEKAG